MTAVAPPRQHRLGLTLSTIGIVLVVLAAVFEIGGGLLLGMLGRQVADGTSRASVAGAADLTRGLGSPYVVLLMLLVAACLLIPGEQLRRGNIGDTPNAPATLLPSASNSSRFRVLGAGWHALWAIVALIVSLVLLMVPAVATISRGWPTDLDPQYDFTGSWRIVALAAMGLTFAAFASLYKKVHYAGVLARRGETARGGSARKGAWAFATSRWRLDIWVAALGGVVVGFAGAAASLVQWGDDTDADAGSALVFMGVLVVVGGLLFVLGLWLASNFWRAGRPLGYGESYS